MTMQQDSRKVSAAMLETLFPHHPYGTQTVIGSQEHLKNPSITKVKNFYKQFYVANNMAVILAGDFNPDEVIKIIEQYFGDIPTNYNIPPVPVKPERPLRSSIIREV